MTNLTIPVKPVQIYWQGISSRADKNAPNISVLVGEFVVVLHFSATCWAKCRLLDVLELVDTHPHVSFPLIGRERLANIMGWRVLNSLRLSRDLPIYQMVVLWYDDSNRSLNFYEVFFSKYSEMKLEMIQKEDVIFPCWAMCAFCADSFCRMRV